MKRRRSVSVFGMSFLDVMFCGFGAVILLVMLINGRDLERREQVHEEVRTEVNRLERELLAVLREQGRLSASLEQARGALDASLAAAAGLRTNVQRAREGRAALDAETLARRESVERLKTDLKTLDADTRRLGAQAETARESGSRVRAFLGDGDRQYLTGLKMGGRRVLILVDASASMLDETIVNVIRRRNMDDASKRQAPKWRRAIATVEWMLSQLPAQAQVQMQTFGTRARALPDAAAARWVASSDAAALDDMVAALRKVVPAGGTSLHAAFSAIRAVQPAPDNVMLITDGLPTQGASPPVLATVSSRERLQHFESAVQRLRPAMPVNTILFPMEGDPLAAAAFWQLAGFTRGSFISPARDWP